MRTFGLLHLLLATLSILVVLISASPVEIPPPPPPTDVLNSTTTLPTPVVPFIFNPDFVSLERRGPPEKDIWVGCDRVDVGKHNCPLMKKACFMFFEYNYAPGSIGRAKYKDLCKRWICAQTYGDCSPNSCNWCP
ncbi:hypothetical protein M436DRAFT_82516 [Aureobasidium namibiae CBS 147.97]|uniref:ShKT domain-containing protein n=1 Tax=Aureobasidium namibiae CBS 147.97 TaxID=1043004 RepID=A0A074XCP8_9PEZI